MLNYLYHATHSKKLTQLHVDHWGNISSYTDCLLLANLLCTSR